jgi:hypothetical protein
MNLGKWFLAVIVLVGAVHAWHVHQRSVIDRELSASADSNGFVPVIMPDGAPADTVLILAALNCPSAQAQRANDMAKQKRIRPSTKWPPSTAATNSGAAGLSRQECGGSAPGSASDSTS